LKLFAQHMTGRLLQTPVFPDVYDGPSFPSFVQQLLRPAYIDMVATYDDSRARVSVLNRHPGLDWESVIQMDGPVEVTELYCDDLAATNTFEAEKVAPTTVRYSADEWKNRVHTVRKHSWQIIVQV
jgi:alpha-N-arabinofuranosidase